MAVPDVLQTPVPKPLTYLTAVSKGRILLALMRAPDTSIPAAPPFLLDDIAKWGYSSVRYGADELLEEFGPLLNSLGSDTYMYDSTGGSSVDLTFRHHKAAIVDKAIYPATSAYFCSVMNADIGMFIAVNNIGPAAKLVMKGKVSPLPLLHHWSDIAFLQWSSLPAYISPATPSPLRYVLRAEIQSADTLNVVACPWLQRRDTAVSS
jgi:hypothetical protein